MWAVQEWTADGFIGCGRLGPRDTMKFTAQSPQQVGGHWQMTVNGGVFRRQ